MKIKKYHSKLLGIFMAFFTLIAYAYIILTINRGTSCDEGYYLLSYLPHQPIHWGISQFEFIIRKLCWFLPEDSALMLRYIRYFLHILLSAFFAFSSYKWLRIKYSFSISSLVYYSFIFLTGILSFGFASPILYYDNLQLFIYLLAFSFFFLYATSSSSVQKSLFLLLCGILMTFAVFNYLPSGILLIISILFLSFIEDKKIKNILFLLIGVILGLIIYHVAIRDIFLTISDIKSSFLIAQHGTTKHDNNHLILALVKYLMGFVGFLIFFVVVGLLINLIKRLKISWLTYLLCTFFALLFLGIILQRWIFTKFHTDIFIVPIALVLSYIIAGKFEKRNIQIAPKSTLIFGLLLFIPLMGVFGTNQDIAAKMLFFMPFWTVAYFLLIALIGFKNENYFVKLSQIVSVLLLVAGFTYLVYFNRFHYYYTPKKSTSEITNDARFQHIKVSKWQKDFNEKAIQILNENGFRKNDKILAFYDNFITVYIAGGYIPENLIYQFEVFASDKKNIPSQPVNYILIIEEQEKPMTEFLKDTNWDFPGSYQRFDLGKAAENLPAGYHSILFIKKK